jgi:dTDP-4-dehydrorhamnose reductase
MSATMRAPNGAPTKILITGKNGQLGYELTQLLSADPAFHVCATDRTQLDLTKPDQIRRVVRTIKPQLIINAAAYTAVDAAEKDAVIAMQVNGVAPGILAEEAERLGAPIIHYSTDYVFAGDGNRPYREDDAVSPTSVYGKTKLAGELAVSSIASRHLILRAAWLYSNRRHNFLLTMLRLARERDQLRVVNDQLGSPTWVREVSNATRKMIALENGELALTIPSGVYHVAATGVTSWHGFADAIIKNTEDPQRRAKQVEAISTAEFKAPAKRPAYSVLSHEKLDARGLSMRDWQAQLMDCIAERKAAMPEDALSTGTSSPSGVQLFVPTFEIDECLAEIRECLEKGWTGLGYKTVAFEDAWKKYTALPHAHFLNSATVGLHLAVEVLKRKHQWQDGDEIITTPLTFVSDSHTILYANMKPVFADVDEYLCLDPKDVERKITPRTRAVMFVGMGGNTGRYAEVLALCRAKGLAVILDAAHMAGTHVEQSGDVRHVGHDADVTVFSYQAVKNLPTADSGMICFRDVADDEVARKLTWLGINKDTYSRSASQGNYKWMYDVEFVGYKYHGNSIMAAIALVQLPYLDRDNARRRDIAARYRAGFAPYSHIHVVPVAPGCESATHLLQIRVKNRDALMDALNDDAIYPGVHYRDNTLYRMFAYGDGTCPNARRASDEIISLPLHLRLTDADVDRVIASVIAHAEK